MFFSQPTVEAGTEQGRNVSEWLSQVYLLSIWPEHILLNICPQNILKILVLDWIGYNEDVSGPT